MGKGGGSEYSFRQRQAHPVLGAWISRDPLGLVAGATLYGYVDGNPINATDPTGEDVFYLFDPKVIDTIPTTHAAVLIGPVKPRGTYVYLSVDIDPNAFNLLKIPNRGQGVRA